MIIETQIQKWGNGAGLRVSGPLRKNIGFEPGTKVEIEILKDGFTVRKAKKRRKKPRLSRAEIRRRIDKFFPKVKDLLKGVTPEMYDEFDVKYLPQEIDF